MQPNDGRIGFIDPAEEEYTTLFTRDGEGKIIPANPQNSLAAHIIDELKLWKPIHQRMWKLERIKNLSDRVKNAISSVGDETLKRDLMDVHYPILVALDELYDSIFVENE